MIAILGTTSLFLSDPSAFSVSSSVTLFNLEHPLISVIDVPLSTFHYHSSYPSWHTFNPVSVHPHPSHISNHLISLLLLLSAFPTLFFPHHHSPLPLPHLNTYSTSPLSPIPNHLPVSFPIITNILILSLYSPFMVTFIYLEVMPLNFITTTSTSFLSFQLNQPRISPSATYLFLSLYHTLASQPAPTFVKVFYVSYSVTLLVLGPWKDPPSIFCKVICVRNGIQSDPTRADS